MNAASHSTALGHDVDALAAQLNELSAAHRSRLLKAEWWNDRLLDWSISHPSFRTQLFRFVDVFPATSDDRDVFRHLEEYLNSAELPRPIDLGLGLLDQIPFAPALSAAVARRSIERMARQFIAGSEPNEAVAKLQAMWIAGSASTVDVLGEKTVTDDEAARYLTRVEELLSALVSSSRSWPRRPLLEEDDKGTLPRVNISVKPTALSPRYAPLSSEEGVSEALTRLAPVLETARRDGALVHIDMEHYDAKELTLELVRRILDEPKFAELDLGITVQAYLVDSLHDLEELIDRSTARPTPLLIRLVKGAYWDTERLQSNADGWPVPVFEHKSDTDANFDRCATLLHDHHGQVRAAFASHNLRSLAHAIAYARSLGIADNGYEIQMLYGMAESFHEAVRALGLRLRVYAPVGELLPGMAYLVRRLLENTANESFVRAHLRHEPQAASQKAHSPSEEHSRTRARDETGTAATESYRPEPLLEWRQADVRERFAATVIRVEREHLGADVPAFIAGRRMKTKEVIESLDPSAPHRLVATSSSCGIDEVEEAIAAARRALPDWRRSSAEDRATVLFRAASWMRERRMELAALEIFEAAKPWADADADVCEAIDYCEYYGREMLRLAKGATVQSPPGEENTLRYFGRGIGAVISPWNFPLAIPTGMTTAALVCGNAVVLKPAEQTPLVASKLLEALRAAGLPDGVLSFLPGKGEIIGAHLVSHPDISFVAFTGSKAVGLGIIEAAAKYTPGQRDVRKVVAEMGGKNAIVVDEDADLDQAVPITVASAFGYSGQKCSACSRVIVVGAIYDEFVERLVGATKRLSIGQPEMQSVDIGPLIDEEARQRVLSYVARAPSDGAVLLARHDTPSEGYFVGPTVVGDVRRGSPIATEEIFGPFLAVMRATSFDEAISIANETEYALTAGVVSRSPAHVRLATEELRAGNVYVNRSITGAVVGRHPFGGWGLSGVGSKAGGPDYLLQFLEPKALSENTVRQGSAPTSEPGS